MQTHLGVQYVVNRRCKPRHRIGLLRLGRSHGKCPGVIDQEQVILNHEVAELGGRERTVADAQDKGMRHHGFTLFSGVSFQLVAE